MVPDLETVVKGLECCDDTSRESLKCEDCPYREDNTCYAIAKLHADALELLKPVVPKSDGHWWFCGECNNWIYSFDRFCSRCGRAINWAHTTG